jgi:aspartyl-tRNA(Asn)/glutamyl-tRNA(Gln) amidotransferase subunit A
MTFTACTVRELSRALLAREATSVDITEHFLSRIARHDGASALGAFLAVDGEGARAAARASDVRRARGEALSPIDGVPIAIKDNIVTEGIVTTAASRILEGWTPPYDATVVARLKRAGAIVLGKTNLDEFGMGSSTEKSAYKPAKNPWDTTRTPGGSSGGSAIAVCAALSPCALGTDTGGSIRQPAAFTGTVGVKPTYGRVSRFGVIAYASSLDQVGTFTHDVADAALLLPHLAGVDARDATSVDAAVPDYAAALTDDLRGMRVGIPIEYTDGLAGETKDALDDARRALVSRGAQVIDVTLPHTQYAIAAYYVIATAEASSNLARYDGVRFGPRRGEEKGLLGLYEDTRGQLFGDEVKRRILLGTYVLSSGYYDAYYLRAQKVRAKIAHDFTRAFENVDVILSPTSPFPAFTRGEKSSDPLAMYLADIYTISANLAGLPAMSMNARFTTTGLPLGVQLMARPFEESTMLRAAHALERELALGVRIPAPFET